MLQIILQWDHKTLIFTSNVDIRTFLMKSNFSIYKFANAKVVYDLSSEHERSCELCNVYPIFGLIFGDRSFYLSKLYPNPETAFSYISLLLVSKYPEVVTAMRIQSTIRMEINNSNFSGSFRIWVYQYGVSHGPFSLLTMRQYSLLGFICCDDNIIFNTPDMRRRSFKRCELYCSNVNSAFTYFPLSVLYCESKQIQQSESRPIHIQQDDCLYGPFSATVANYLYHHNYINLEWNTIRIHPQVDLRNQISHEFYAHVLKYQPDELNHHHFEQQNQEIDDCKNSSNDDFFQIPAMESILKGMSDDELAIASNHPSGIPENEFIDSSPHSMTSSYSSISNFKLNGEWTIPSNNNMCDDVSIQVDQALELTLTHQSVLPLSINSTEEFIECEKNVSSHRFIDSIISNLAISSGGNESIGFESQLVLNYSASPSMTSLAHRKDATASLSCLPSCEMSHKLTEFVSYDFCSAQCGSLLSDNKAFDRVSNDSTLSQQSVPEDSTEWEETTAIIDDDYILIY